MGRAGERAGGGWVGAGALPLHPWARKGLALLLTAGYVSISYALMLAAMSYNVGVMAALALGVASHRVRVPVPGGTPGGCP